MPKVASIADKFAFIRSLVGSAGAHDAFQCQSGFPAKDLQSLGGRPALGSVVAKLRGSPRDAAPPFVDLMQGRPLVRNSARPGFLGPTYNPFRPDISKMFARELEAGMKKELAARGGRPHHPADAGGRPQRRAAARPHPAAGRLRHAPPRPGRQRHDGGDGPLHPAGGEHPHLGPVRRRRWTWTRSRRAMLERYTPAVDAGADRFYTSEDGTAVRKLLLARRLVEAGRALRERVVQRLRHPLEELPADAAAAADRRPRPARPGDRPGRARHAGRRLDRRLGRVRPDAEDQQGRRPRPLAGGRVRRCWPAAA